MKLDEMSRGTTLTHLSELFTRKDHDRSALYPSSWHTAEQPPATHTKLLDLPQPSPSCPLAVVVVSARSSLARRCRGKDGRRERADEVRLERLEREVMAGLDLGRHDESR
jgi:hypothetical protein